MYPLQIKKLPRRAQEKAAILHIGFITMVISKLKDHNITWNIIRKVWSILLNIRLTHYLLYACMTAVKMGPNLSEILKGKLSLGARIIQEGGRRNIFNSVFWMQEKELLLKASQCYLYTTAGPIAGILFVSTAKVAFYSERPITFSSVTGELVRAPYKVGFMCYNTTQL